jgi:murein DD-endopeptidase MepM/ murein hydrolase activator NlpD
MADDGAPMGISAQTDFAGRAPYAIAAALAVIIGGAAFIAFAMSRPTLPAPPVAAEIAAAVEPAPEAPRAMPDAAPTPAGIVDLAPVDAAPKVKDDVAAKFGGPLRINPARGDEPEDAGVAGLVPTLKPKAGSASGSMGAARVLSLASVFLADESDRPAPFFFEADLDPSAGAARSLTIFEGDMPSAPRELRLSLVKGETFVDVLRRAGVRTEDRNEAALAFGKEFNLRRLRPGQEFAVTVADPYMTYFQLISATSPPAAFLLSLDFQLDHENRVRLTRNDDGAFVATRHETPLATRIAAVRGRIDGSLYLSAKRQGAPDEVIAALAQMFAYDVDFQRDIFGGDEFEAIFEVRFDESGELVAGGDILYGRLNWRSRSKEKGYYRFETADGGDKADYFDASGESARRLLMKTPIDGARLSSGFGTRRHPILGYQKAHKGVDFAASRGTPIMAAGDGVVERAGPYGSFGNYVRIRHAQGYKTAYAHMNAIKKGVRTGARVRQGDVIGYVGSTGRSTGPHLHYEVHLKDKPVNPQSLKIATGYELGGKELARFRLVRDGIDAMRAPAAEEASNLAAANEKSGKSL